MDERWTARKVPVFGSWRRRRQGVGLYCIIYYEKGMSRRGGGREKDCVLLTYRLLKVRAGRTKKYRGVGLTV